MFDLNTDHPPPKPFGVYDVCTDGSAISKLTSTRTGAYAARILCPDGHVQVVCGSAAPTTISRMEIAAITHALEWIRDREGGPYDYQVQLTCDSEFVVQTILGRYGRNKNFVSWAAFDEASKDMALQIRWTARNTVPEQAECDALCDKLRRSLADDLANPELSSKILSVTRESKLP